MQRRFGLAVLTLFLVFSYWMGSLFLFEGVVFAHPGRTAGDGCHYCRTNCSSWGKVEGARHCHGGGSTSTTNTTTVVPTAVPVVYPTVRPVVYPTAVPTGCLSYECVNCGPNEGSDGCANESAYK